eukprot:EG_transcript_19300
MAFPSRISVMVSKVRECQPPQQQRPRTTPSDVRYAAVAQLTDAQRQLLLDVFTLLDETDSGCIAQGDLALAVQFLGIQATKHDLLRMTEWLGLRTGQAITFDDFFIIMFVCCRTTTLSSSSGKSLSSSTLTVMGI